MTTLHNEVTIDAPLERVWSILADIDLLGQYDPTVEKAELTSSTASGPGASRRVTMADGKHWFEETISEFEPEQSLRFELTACNFPISRLTHSYGFEESNGTTTVRQVMDYQVKYGPIGSVLDKLAFRRRSDTGVKKFLSGLKTRAEAHGRSV